MIYKVSIDYNSGVINILNATYLDRFHILKYFGHFKEQTGLQFRNENNIKENIYVQLKEGNITYPQQQVYLLDINATQEHINTKLNRVFITKLIKETKIFIRENNINTILN
jgi:hypothetical protein